MPWKSLTIVMFISILVSGYFYFSPFVFLNRVESGEPQALFVDLKDGYNHKALSYAIGEEFGWGMDDEKLFQEAIRGITWDAYNQDILEYLTQELEWGELEREAFLIHGTQFIIPPIEILGDFFVPGLYEFSSDDTPAFVAEKIVSRIDERYSNKNKFFDRVISKKERTIIEAFVRGEVELLPDLIPLPPQDITLKQEGGRDFLLFSTTYYNVGEGPLELVADPGTAGIKEDIDRVVLQRIYKTDDSYRDTPVGIFLWHEEHLHYHYSDFVTYVLSQTQEENISARNQHDHVHDDSHPHVFSGKQEQKTTFCIRDVTQINDEAFKDSEARYLICGKERQGVSVGWGDTYFFTYVDQNLDITDLASGVYTLSFNVNPENILNEITRNNNKSFATIEIDKETGTVKVLNVEPKEFPEFNHVYRSQVF